MIPQELNSYNNFNIIAHRGDKNTAPENTLAAFDAAYKNGYDTVECDIRWSKDDVPVIIHDKTLNRTAVSEKGCNLFFNKKCSKLDYDELLKYDFGKKFSDEFKGEKIPSFEEVLDCCADNDGKLYVELKKISDFNDKKAQTLFDMVDDAGLSDNVTWISFEEDYLEKINDLDADCRLGLLSKNSVDEDVIDKINNLKTSQNEVFLGIKASEMTKKGCSELKEEDIPFEAWGFEDIDEIKDLFLLGASGATSNFYSEEINDLLFPNSNKTR